MREAIAEVDQYKFKLQTAAKEAENWKAKCF